MMGTVVLMIRVFASRVTSFHAGLSLGSAMTCSILVSPNRLQATVAGPGPAEQANDASSATLAFLGKLVAKAGCVEIGSATRLLPSRMSKSLHERYGGSLSALVTAAGEPYGLAVAGEGTLIVAASQSRAEKKPITKPSSSPGAVASGNSTMSPMQHIPTANTPRRNNNTTVASHQGLGRAKATAPPPPPPPPPPKFPSLGNTTAAPMGAAVIDVFNLQLRTWKSPAEIVDSLMEFVPTFWIRSRHVHNALPQEMKDMYNDRMRVHQFLRKFQFYFDTKVMPDGPYVKIRESCSHPKKGFADDRYASSLLEKDSPGAAVSSDRSALSVPESTTLEGRLRSLLGDAFVPLKQFEAALPHDVQQHKDFDKVAGVAAVFERYPQYFQIVDGNVRLRQLGVAPNALDDRTVETSPDPEVFRKIYSIIPENLECAVETSVLYASLTAEEKTSIKRTYRSFPRFLRQHGRVICVAQDNLTVRRFAESLPDDVEHFDGSSTDKHEIIGKALPSETSFNATSIELALKELFEALPLTQACPLDDALFCVPAVYKEALRSANLVDVLQEYPSYFAVWQFPDDPNVIVLQRASLNIPDVASDEITATVQPLIPQGGIAVDRLLRKVPASLQRYFYRHGLKKTLASLPTHFMVAGDRVLSLGR